MVLNSYVEYARLCYSESGFPPLRAMVTHKQRFFFINLGVRDVTLLMTPGPTLEIYGSGDNDTHKQTYCRRDKLCCRWYRCSYGLAETLFCTPNRRVQYRAGSSVLPSRFMRYIARDVAITRSKVCHSVVSVFVDMTWRWYTEQARPWSPARGGKAVSMRCCSACDIVVSLYSACPLCFTLTHYNIYN